MNTERMKNLLAVLHNVPDEAFHMGYWWRENCQTVGCALGHYLKAHPDCGLSLRPFAAFGGNAIVPTLTSDPRLIESAALAVHFGISGRDADYLFQPMRYYKASG